MYIYNIIYTVTAMTRKVVAGCKSCDGVRSGGGGGCRQRGREVVVDWSRGRDTKGVVV